MIFRVLLISGFAVVLGWGVAGAQTPAADPPPSEQMIVEQKPSQTLSRELIGSPVMHEEDGEIGWLESLLFDDDDRIVGGVVAIGGFLGIGQKHVALRWSEFDVRPEEEAVFLSVTREQLDLAPDFQDRASVRAKRSVTKEPSEPEVVEPAPRE